MKKLFALTALLLTSVGAFADAGFTNTPGTGYCVDETSSTFPSECAKPSAAVDGTVLDITQAINDQTAGAFTFAINGAGQTVTVNSGPTNAPTLFQAGSQWRLGLTADSTPFQGNNANAASAQKTMLVIAVTGANTTTPIRATAVSTGTSTAPLCPTTASINAGDLVLRKAIWHDDGDGAAVTRVGGSHTAGPLHQPAAANGKAIMVDYYVASGSGAPGTATFGIAASRPWVCETTVYAAAGGGSSPVAKILQQH